MKPTKMLLAAFFLLFCGFSQTILAQKEDAAVSYPAVRNERLTIQALRQINGAQATFQATNPNGNFGTLLQLAKADFIDDILASGSKYGYYFTVTLQNRTATLPARYSVVAVPQFYRRTGNRSFYLDESGVIRGRDRQGAPATQNDPPVEDTCYPTEECVIRALRTLTGAQATYLSAYGSYGSLCQLKEAGLIDEVLASGSKYGYYFVTVPTRTGENQQYFLYKAIAIPQNYPNNGRRSFFTNESGVIFAADKNGAPAGADDPPLEY